VPFIEGGEGLVLTVLMAVQTAATMPPSKTPEIMLPFLSKDVPVSKALNEMPTKKRTTSAKRTARIATHQRRQYDTIILGIIHPINAPIPIAMNIAFAPSFQKKPVS